MNFSATELLHILGQLLAYTIAGFGGILLMRVKEWYEVQKSNTRITSQINYNSMIREALAEAREHFDGDRVKLFQFKNGTYFHSGESEQKLTLTHIVYRFGTGIPAALLPSYTDIPISHLTNTLQATIKNKVFAFSVNENEDFFVRQNFAANNTSMVLMTKVHNSKEKLIGVVMISWRDEKDLKVDDQVVEYMEILASRIGVLLSNPI